MLTRLKVTGFKNLVDVDVRFGPFTCIAGANGVGKSNLFDAIRFLGATADKTLLEAALSVRDEKGRSAKIRSIFHRHGDSSDPVMSFVAEMIVPLKTEDDLGQPAKATATFLRYTLNLRYRPPNGGNEGLEVLKEELAYIPRSEANKHLWFAAAPECKEWKKSVLHGTRRGPNFISTEGEDGDRGVTIKRHQDGGAGRPLLYPAKGLPRTVLSSSNAQESRTALAARRELQSWRMLQLEPSALREPDRFDAPTRLGANGSHLPATLNRLCAGAGDDKARNRVLCELSNRLAELIPDIREIKVDRDDKRELYTIQVCGRDKTWFDARSLSDGTLRFLALAILAQDPEETGLICLEEPENGIHPARIPAFLRLLQDIALETKKPASDENPVRQVVINTHSPIVVSVVSDDSLLLAQPIEKFSAGIHFDAASFIAIGKTWRTSPPKNSCDTPTPACAKGDLFDYLGAKYGEEEEELALIETESTKKNHNKKSRKSFTPRTVKQRYEQDDFFGDICE
jgi:predicted ATPase